MRSRANERAFEAFVAESGDALLRIAVLLTCDVRLAEDVYQETLQRVAAQWSRVTSPKAFARRVLHNLVIDHGRAKTRRGPTSHLDPVRHPADPRAASELDAVELRPALFAALRTLTVTQRAVIVLRYFDDRSEAEVARLLDITPGTVKSTASRSMARLRVEPGLVALFAARDSSDNPDIPDSPDNPDNPDIAERKERDHAHR
jgi:RNA polymerase sigma-70 factor (sigma-E family)